MARSNTILTKNTDLAISIISNLLGISKSHFLRMALIHYAILTLSNKSSIFSETDKQYIVSLLIMAINETSEKELNQAFKSQTLATLTQLIKNVSNNETDNTDKNSENQH